MSSLEQLHPNYEWQGETTAVERLELLDFDGEVERLAAAAVMLGPVATMFTFERPPQAPVFAESLATAADVAHSVEFVPPVEAEYPEWRNIAETHVAGAAIMFASQRPDMAEYNPENLALAA